LDARPDPGRHLLQRALRETRRLRGGQRALRGARGSEDIVEAVEQVAEPLALRAQVLDVLGVGRRLQRDALFDVEAEPFESRI